MSKYILIVGGAGYIGSHMVDYLHRTGYTPIVLDNLSTGHRDAVLNAELIVGDMADPIVLDQVFSTYSFTAVMHFASFIQVGESVLKPAKYYQNNVAGTLTLLQAMLHWQVKRFIFSSSAAVYGNPLYSPIDEQHPLMPINPYGQTKWMTEKILTDFAQAYDFQFAALRYFNAAGADPSGRLHERHEPETHFIPLLLEVARKQRGAITLFGDDYATIDGTCVRDYIHVADLCEAHFLALDALLKGEKSLTYNLGTGRGYSLLEVVNMAREITDYDIPLQTGPRRAGDPAILVADASLACRELGWSPQFSALETIIEHAWQASLKAVPQL